MNFFRRMVSRVRGAFGGGGSRGGGSSGNSPGGGGGGRSGGGRSSNPQATGNGYVATRKTVRIGNSSFTRTTNNPIP